MTFSVTCVFFERKDDCETTADFVHSYDRLVSTASHNTVRGCMSGWVEWGSKWVGSGGCERVNGCVGISGE